MTSLLPKSNQSEVKMVDYAHENCIYQGSKPMITIKAYNLIKVMKISIIIKRKEFSAVFWEILDLDVDT